MRIVFNEELCIQCHGCQTSCDVLHGLKDGIHFRRLKIEWEGNYPTARMRLSSVACMHCADAACLEGCPTGAVYRDEKTGAVRVDADVCVGCGVCVGVCPYGIPQINADNKMVKCSLCDTPVCVWNCPTRALELLP